MKVHKILITIGLALVSCSATSNSNHLDERVVDGLISLFEPGSNVNQVVDELTVNWKSQYAVLLVETIYLHPSPRVTGPLWSVLKQKTGKNFEDLNEWYQWIWSQPAEIIENYGVFKALLYQKIDDRFYKYFYQRDQNAEIRLDEVRWGGVLQDGIPPLRNPSMISAAEATYLQDDNVVFGIEVNGDVRAYPKRILAWHEMFTDRVGGIPVAGVYCTLCGTVVLYDTEVDGKQYHLGTSGFLYRSNKLMYDRETQSLWNTLWGEPVIGPLVGKGIQLPHRSVVTTTWGEWKRRHPDTKVLSLATGHTRDYREGAAYKDYFATDRLMFEVPFDDRRLKNKQEVLALRFVDEPKEQLAIATNFLKRNPIYYDAVGNTRLVVITDASGANRVYEVNEEVFEEFDGKNQLKDRNGATWVLHEDRLENDRGDQLLRLPYHRAFWFGWHAAFPQTRLVK